MCEIDEQIETKKRRKKKKIQKTRPRLKSEHTKIKQKTGDDRAKE